VSVEKGEAYKKNDGDLKTLKEGYDSEPKKDPQCNLPNNGGHMKLCFTAETRYHKIF
jgi:hypothetical protein